MEDRSAGLQGRLEGNFIYYFWRKSGVWCEQVNLTKHLGKEWFENYYTYEEPLILSCNGNYKNNFWDITKNKINTFIKIHRQNTISFDEKRKQNIPGYFGSPTETEKHYMDTM